MLCVYHVADNDGKGSAAIVKNLYPEIELFGLNHDMEVPFEDIRQHDEIIVCDISLPLDFMFELNQTKDFTWIDHHVSVITEYDKAISQGQKPIKGIRRVGTAAICLTWEYFHPQENVPEGIHLIGLNDIFDLRDDRVRPFEYAFQSLGVNRPQDKSWTEMINNQMDIAGMVDKGRSILSWIRSRNYRLVRSMAFESQYMGHKCICANMAQGYSEFFDSIENIEEYDFMVNFFMNRQNRWNLSFYTAKDNVDVSQIAATMGGGGHQKAAGASKLKKLPAFLDKVTIHE